MKQDGSTITNVKTQGILFPGNLRDYFAGQALAGLASATEENGGWAYGGPGIVAGESYRIADAMMKAREKK